MTHPYKLCTYIIKEKCVRELGSRTGNPEKVPLLIPEVINRLTP